MDRPLQFVSGLPRSGTTVLMNLLGQNPAHYVSPTSGLIHLMRHAMERWPEYQEFRAAGLEKAKPFVLRGLRGLLYGFYQEQFDAGQTVFDKSRGWLHFIEPLEQILGRRVKVVTVIRDVRSIVASFEKIYRRRGIEYRYAGGDAEIENMTVAGRARHVLAPQQVTGRSLLRLRDALDRCGDRLVMVPYETFAQRPAETMAAIHAALGLPKFDYDPDHVEQITHEDDNFIGMDLHQIRPRIEAAGTAPWEGLLPDELSAEIAESYADINALAAGSVIDGANVA